jgi:hypothetical protein
MKSRLMLLVLGLLVAGVLVAGCGGDDGGGSSDAPATTAAVASDSGDAGRAEVVDDPAIQQAIDTCKQQVAANPQISDKVKADLDAVCEKAASGDAAAAAEATRQVCLTIIDEAGLPGSAADQAKAACEQATASP